MTTGINACKQNTQGWEEGGEREKKCHVRWLIFELGNDFQAYTRPLFSYCLTTCPLRGGKKEKWSVFRDPGVGIFRTLSPPPLSPSPCPSSLLGCSWHFCQGTGQWPGSWQVLVAPCQAESWLAQTLGTGLRPAAHSSALLLPTRVPLLRSVQGWDCEVLNFEL